LIEQVGDPYIIFKAIGGNMYKSFAQVYDDLMQEVDYEQWGDYLYRLLLNGKQKTETILEFGCGTGSITSELLKRDYNVSAVDISEEMLTIASEKIAEKYADHVNFYMGDMSNFQINQEFDAVISACDTVNYLSSLEKINDFFVSSYDALRKGGTLLFDINSSGKFKEVINNNTFIYDLENVYCTWENDPHFEENRIDYHLTFFVKREDGSYIRHDEEQCQYLYKAEDIYHLLQQTGFKNIKAYNFGTYTAGANEGDRIQFFAEK